MAFQLREIVYDIRERLKVLMSDDSKITDEYLIHLISVKRAFFLKQKYSDLKKYIPDELKQIICIDLEVVPSIDDLPCSDKVLRSINTIPEMINFNGFNGISKILTHDMLTIPFNFITMDRLPYTGNNKWLAKQLYCAIGADRKLYFKSKDTQFKLLKHIKVIGLFSNPVDAKDYSCVDEEACTDILDLSYPIEDSLVQLVVQGIVQELTFTSSIKDTSTNDAKESTIE